MTINRREFVVGAAAFGLAAGGMTFGAEAADKKPLPPEAKGPAALKLSSQLGLVPGKNTEERLAAMDKMGFDGCELGGDIVGNEKKYLDAFKNAKVKVSAICWGSCNGDLVKPDETARKNGIEALTRVLESAGQLKSTGVIFVPAFNGQTPATNQEIRKILLDILPALGEHALKCGTRVILEPLNRGEAFFLRQLADAASICRDSKSDGIALMGDFYHMGIEETSDLGAFISAGSRLHHVHLATTEGRVLPGQDGGKRSYVDGFRGLKLIGYQDYCSFECGIRGDAKVEIPKAMQLLKDQWAQA
jgi:sugar phosphate isomerase/epimerase